MNEIKFPRYDVKIDAAGLSLAEMKAARDALLDFNTVINLDHQRNDAADFASELLICAVSTIENQMAVMQARTTEDAHALAALWLDSQDSYAGTGFIADLGQSLANWIKATAAQPQIMQAAE